MEKEATLENPTGAREAELEIVPVRNQLTDPMAHVGKFQRRVAQLKAADVTIFDIARIMECTEGKVVQCLHDRKVQQLILKLGALTSDDMRPKIQEVNELLQESLREAFENEVALMRRTFNRGDETEPDLEAEKLCHNISSSLLDRGGISAPKRLETKNTNLHLGAESITTIANVLKELDEV